MPKKSSVKAGVLLSYGTVILTAITNMVLIPFYIRTLGSDAYGLYEYVYSLASYATIIDFGISNVMIRYITEYKVKKDSKSEENFAAHILVLTIISALFILAIGIVMFLNLNKMIVNRSPNEMKIARGIFFFMIGRIILALLQHFFDGALLSNEHFIEAKGIACTRIAIKFVSVITLVLSFRNVYGIVIGDFFSSLICVCISAYYTCKIKFKIKWYFFDRNLFKEVSLLIFALVLQSIVNFANNALDKYVVGGFLTNTMVTVYSVALSLYEVFQTITISINPIFMPKVTKTIAAGGSKEDITDVAISIGRLQAILCLGMYFGFLICGKHFLLQWSGDETTLAWLPMVLLMSGGMLPLVQSTCLSVLTVYNKRLFRSIVLFGIAIGNLILSIFLVRIIGINGVALGTFIAFIIGNGFVMNIYYRKRIGLNVKRMLYGIFRGILPSALSAALICYLFVLLTQQGWIWLLMQIIVFCVSYLIFLMIFGFNSEEKKMIKEKTNQIMVRFKRG